MEYKHSPIIKSIDLGIAKLLSGRYVDNSPIGNSLAVSSSKSQQDSLINYLVTFVVLLLIGLPFRTHFQEIKDYIITPVESKTNPTLVSFHEIEIDDSSFVVGTPELTIVSPPDELEILERNLDINEYSASNSINKKEKQQHARNSNKIQKSKLSKEMVNTTLPIEKYDYEISEKNYSASNSNFDRNPFVREEESSFFQ